MRLRPAPLVVLALALAGCRPDPSTGGAGAVAVATTDSLPAEPRRGASPSFWRAWGDGNAEMSSYRATVGRYGATRTAEVVLIYVTEPVSRRTWVKDDAATGDDRVNVLKLNHSLKFQTGIYPYSVLTSVFAPTDDFGGERFAPAKVTMTAQEWCGHVFHGLWPGSGSFRSTLFSYFADEGEATERVPVAQGALYEDALLIQLRELDGPFAGGGAWSGPLVPSLWGRRTAHVALRPVAARITRADTVVGGAAATRFTLAYPGLTRTYAVEKAAPRRVLAWADSRGETATLIRTARLPYWQLNGPSDEARRADLGLAPIAEAPPAVPGSLPSDGSARRPGR